MVDRSASNRGTARSVVIVGGGLAGIAAALQLAEQGTAVTLIETRKRLGGRATSFADPASGQLLDNCQHVLLGCCTHLIDLYERLGVGDAIDWHRRLYFTAPPRSGQAAAMDGTTAEDEGEAGWVIDELEATDLPAPLHMTQPLMAFRTLTLREKIAIARGMAAVMRLGRSGREKVDDVSFHDWLKRNGQPDGAIEKFWAVITISALNELPERSSLRYAMQVFQDGFLANERAYIMGLAAVPLVELYDPAKRIIEAAGGRVLLGAGADSFVYEQGRVSAVRLNDGTRITGDAFISTVPFDRLNKLCDDAMRQDDTRLRQLDRLTVSPIIGVHLWMRREDGRPVMELPHLIFMHSPLQWLFSKGRDEQAGAAAWHLHGVISAAYELVDQPAEQIIDLVLGEMRKALPATRAAQLVHARVVKEKRATFCVRPGADAWRPGPTGAIDNLYLGGDWCDTGWPATMEGAVRSGYTAAGAWLQANGRTSATLPRDLADSALYRLMASR